MIKAAVLGSPISHSLSPFVHNRAYEILGIVGSYERFDVSAEEFPSFLDFHSGDGFTGFSLTMPLKEAALKMGFEVDARAIKISSANTLIHQGSSYRVLSTDVMAFDRLLAPLSFSTVAIIGGGGTARAALGALDSLVDEITMIQRDDSRNSLLQKCVEVSSLKFEKSGLSLEGFDLVISTTPKGASDLYSRLIPEHPHILIESLYDPSPTVLSAAWSAGGGEVIDGLDLLVEQALDQIHLMTNQSFDYTSMRTTLLAELREHQSQK